MSNFLNKNQQCKSRKKTGFTLIEMLVYLAIFTIVTTASVTLLLSLNNFINQYRIETALYRSGTGVMEQILLSLRQAETVDLLNTIVEDPTQGQLTVETSATTTTFTYTGSELTLTINGDAYGNLITDNVTVDVFTVYHYPIVDGEYVRVKLVLSATLDGISKDLILYGGAVIR